MYGASSTISWRKRTIVAPAPFIVVPSANLGSDETRYHSSVILIGSCGSLRGFRLAPIEGLVEARAFLRQLEKRTMFCTQYVRHDSRPDYTPEPDIIHEATGHIPNLTNEDFADFSQSIGRGARLANEEQMNQLSRLYWFTVEFGLIEEGERSRPSAPAFYRLSASWDMPSLMKSSGVLFHPGSHQHGVRILGNATGAVCNSVI